MKRLSLSTALVLGMLLLAGTLGMGFYADDYFHQYLLSGREGVPDRVPFGLFDFGTFEQWASVESAAGTFPWWTGEDWTARFFRPGASLFLTGLHGLFGTSAWPYHAVGLALHAAVIALAHGLYLRLGLSRRSADLGALLLATFHGAILPVGWTANHNSVLVALFGIVAVRSLLVDEVRARNLAAALASAVLAVLSKESGAVVFVLVVIVCCVRARRDPKPGERGRLLAGAFLAGLLLAAHVGWFISSGYGTNSQFYADPGAAPERFLANALVLFTAGLVGLLGPLPLDALTMFPAVGPVWIAIGVLGAWPLYVWITRTVGISWSTVLLALWTAGFLMLQAGVAPSDRLLYVPLIGAAGVLGRFFELQAQRRLDGSATRSARLVARGLFVFATFGSGAALLIQSVGMGTVARHLRETALAADVGPAELGPRDVLVLQAESQMQAFTTAFTYRFLADDGEVNFWNLQADARPVIWTRTSPTSFELESRSDPFLWSPFERLYLTRTPDFQVGDTWSTRLFQVEALAVEGGLPTRLRFEFERDLEHPSLRFVRAELGVLTAIAPPTIGASITLPRPDRAGPWMP